MAYITTSILDASVQNLYDSDYLLAVTNEGVFEQFCKRKLAMNGKRGSAWVFPIYRKLDPAVTPLSQTSSVDPVTFQDDSVSITLSEYGNGVRRAIMVEATAYTDTTKAMARLVAINRAESIELICRNQFDSGSRVYRYGGVARTSLTAATAQHLLTDDNLHNVLAMAENAGIEKLDGLYAAIVPPALRASVLAESAFLTAAQYNLGNKNINLLTGEIGQLAGFRFIVSPWGKVFVGGGADAHANNIAQTTLSSAVSAGDTSCTLANATNAAVGDWITIGSLETANTEMVQVTAVNGNNLTIQGLGNDEVSNTGFKFAHAAGSEVRETQNVCAMIVVGPNAVGKVYSTLTGPMGKSGVSVPDAVPPGRFTDFWWHQIVGYGRIRNWGMIRAEFAAPFSDFVYTEKLT